VNNGQDWTDETLRAAEEAIGYVFADKALLRTAFTHPSYKNIRACEDNDKLEFLGDAVLQICVSEKIFGTDADAGGMTELRQQYVSEEALTAAERRAGLMRFLRYSGGKENLAGKTNSNLFEAVTAAVYLDGGRVAAEAFLFSFLQPVENRNYRAQLQEYVQAVCKKTPEYREEKQENGKFYYRVEALGKSACGCGESKQIAKTRAAESLLRALKNEG